MTLTVSLVAGASLVGCHKTATDGKPAGQGRAAPNPESVKQSFANLRGQFDGLQARSADLAKQIEAVPADLPGYPQLRANFYAFEEARGVTDAKVTLLRGRLDAALKSGRPEELQQVSDELGRVSLDASRIDQQYIKLLHGAMAFERADEHRKGPVPVAGGVKSKSAKSTH